ncbi:hypothetical protein [Nannocystis punicea]|uniref:Uncharacterized protein n=1 Tax=Nannocystis punicea TaxID=2995304 RepID=A0ABY7HJC5_9BACT|nr:hypothetical protein [Nannocystis poenicansa]WAS99145.1 hypothetical protein O0S08_23710 [Nannocystis poenicansa]
MPRPIHRLLLLALPVVLACQAPPTPPAPAAPPAPTTAPAESDAPLLRTYTVPPEQARSIEQALASALSSGKDLPPLGTVERLPDGRLVVVAPPGIQDGVAALVAGLDTAKAPPVRTAEFDYWIVVGEPAQTAEGVDAVPDIAPALQAIVGAQGPMRFRLHESMHLSSLIDDRAEADGSRMRARQTVSEVGGRLVADLDISVAQQSKDRTNLHVCGQDCNQLKSRVHLDPGQLLVIGQAGLGSTDAKAPEGSKTLFYIVRGQLRTGGA